VGSVLSFNLPLSARIVVALFRCHLVGRRGSDFHDETVF
jgi:hypothetical protein